MNIRDGIVAVLNEEGKIVGTGFLVGENLVLTCAHVVVQAGAIDGDTVQVRFDGRAEKIDALVVPEYWRDVDKGDIAVLRLENVPKSITPLPLGNAAGSPGHAFYAYGYAIVTDVQGIGARGKIVDIVDSGCLVQLTSQEPDHGMSGGPVWDEQRRVVIGMVAKGKGLLDKDQNLRNTQTTFATSAQVIFEVCPLITPVVSKRRRHQKGPRSFSIVKNVKDSIVINGEDVQVIVKHPSDKNDTVIRSSRLIHPKITNYLRRPRLTNKIQKVLSEKSICIRADAGYGKTWLIKDFIDTVASDHFVVWFSFSKNQAETLRFVQDWASDIYYQTNCVGAKTLQLAKQRESDTGAITRPSESLSTLLTEIEIYPDLLFVLILEDLHNITEDIVHSAIVTLLESRPQNLRIILTSRNPLPSGQTKLIAQGYLSLLEQGELAFDLEETREYLTSIKKVSLLPEQIEMLYNRTEGWVAALSLGIDSLQSDIADIQEIIRKLSGFDGDIYNFFAEEVYKGFSPDIKPILKKLGIARSITPDIADLFSERSDGGQVLKDMASHNTFLVEVDIKENKRRYQLHALFAEFLETKLMDEDGDNAVRLAHRKLATFYAQNNEQFLAVEHAIDGQDWQTAIKSLEHIGPTGVGLGYGKAFLVWTEKIPTEWFYRSALLCEIAGQAYLQSGDYGKAADVFDRAQELYKANNNKKALNGLEYLSAETALNQDKLSAEDFLQVANRVSQWSYRHNDLFFGVQVELRLIEVGEILVTKDRHMFKELIERSAFLFQKIEKLDSEYDLIRAKILAAQAHLTFENVSFVFKQEVNKVLLREKLGHSIKIEERVAMAQWVLDGLKATWGLYKQAENIAKDKSEIEWAIIYTRHLRDYSYHLFQIVSTGALRNADTSDHDIAIDTETKNYLLSILIEYEKCVAILGKYELVHFLAKTLCDAAAVYDLLGNLKERNRLANIALEIATEKGFTDILEQAQNIIQRDASFTESMNTLKSKSSDDFFASLNDEQKAVVVNNMLHAVSDTEDVDIIRQAISVEVDDLISVAKQRLIWCRHVQIIQDLQHQKSMETFYRSIPAKWIVCAELRYQSTSSGYSFDALWPMFKGVYCLGCNKQSLR